MDTGDLPTYDLIRQFELNEGRYEYELITGSIPTQQAYQLDRESNLTAYTYKIFPRGIPYHFWFESTFRVEQHSAQEWYLIHVTNPFEVTQISVTIDSVQQNIGIGLPDIMGNVQRVFFHHSHLFNSLWHKMLVSVVRDEVRMWIDCQQVMGLRGDYVEQLLPRKKFDTTGGHVYISRYLDETNNYIEVKILIQFQFNNQFKFS